MLIIYNNPFIKGSPTAELDQHLRPLSCESGKPNSPQRIWETQQAKIVPLTGKGKVSWFI